MPLTKEDLALQACLKQRVEQYKAQIIAPEPHPYVWELRLSLDEFNTLESAINKSLDSHSGDYRHLLCEEFAPLVIIYLAEWYKRYYDGAETDNKKKLSLDSSSLEKVLTLSGIDKNTFVYNASKNPDKTSFRWLESIQVLGGFAVKAEIKRDDSDAFLTQLCKLFHGEDIDILSLSDRNRAVAFKESIQRAHSLYWYLDSIINKDKSLPFAKSDLEDRDSDIHILLEKIKNADKAAKKEKFDLEWLISYSPNHAQMVRRLKVKPKPELLGGGHKQYIGYDRLRENWGIEKPEELGRIAVSLRFSNGGHCVKDASFREPLFKYDNTGSEKTGFTAINRIDEAICTDVPASRFDKIELVLKHGGSLKTIQTIPVNDYCQLYKVSKANNEWSSRRNSQAATAVLFSSAYHLSREFRDLPVVYAHFRNGDDCSEDYCWCPINEKVILVDSEGRELPPFFNRNGLFQVVTKKYLDTIKYKENLYALYEYRDLDEDDTELQSDVIPVLFGRDGLMVMQYPNGSSKEGKPFADYDLEWQLPNGRYVDWANKEPEQGPIRLRVTVQGIVFKHKVYYVPFTSSESAPNPIWRDFDHTKICTAINGVADIQDEFIKDPNEQEPDTKQLTIGEENSHLLIDVYRPVILRELSQQLPGEDTPHIIGFSGKDEGIHLPLINLEQFSLRDFSENGVRAYQFKNVNTLYYHFPDFDKVGLAATVFNAEFPVSRLLPGIPIDYLKVYITKAIDNPTDLYAWDFKQPPFPVNNVSDFKADGIVFQSLKDNPAPRWYSMPTIKKGKSGWGGVKQSSTISAIDCFEVVSEHKAYYFLFEPLVKCVSSESIIKELFLPLLSKRDYHLSGNDIANLYRFAVEFHFDWMLLPRDLWATQISEYEADVAKQEIISGAVLDFFRRTPKVTDEREAINLNEFLNVYWVFNCYPKVDPIAEKALRLILSDKEALHNQTMKEFLLVFDDCRFKYVEMSKAFRSSND